MDEWLFIYLFFWGGVGSEMINIGPMTKKKGSEKRSVFKVGHFGVLPILQLDLKGHLFI